MQMRRQKVYEIESILLDICRIPTGFDEILCQAFQRFSLIMNYVQYVLIGSTIRSYYCG